MIYLDDKKATIELKLNALACFDVMIEACQNLSCLSHGAELATCSLMHKPTSESSDW